MFLDLGIIELNIGMRITFKCYYLPFLFSSNDHDIVIVISKNRVSFDLSAKCFLALCVKAFLACVFKDLDDRACR